MTLDELIGTLRDLRREHGGNTPVKTRTLVGQISDLEEPIATHLRKPERGHPDAFVQSWDPKENYGTKVIKI